MSSGIFHAVATHSLSVPRPLPPSSLPKTDTCVTIQGVEREAVPEHLSGFFTGETVSISYLRRDVAVTVRRGEGGAFTSQEISEVPSVAVTCAADDLAPRHIGRRWRSQAPMSASLPSIAFCQPTDLRHRPPPLATPGGLAMSMPDPKGVRRMHLAELNIGRLVAPTDDPRVADFMNALDRINTMGKRMPGFVWMMEGSGEPGVSGEGRGNTDVKLGGDPLEIANLTVWEDVASLENFVWNTVHKQFYERRAEWFEVMRQEHFVMWWVAAGHRPTIDEALQRLSHMQDFGPSDYAFGWDDLAGATLHLTHACVAASAAQ